MTPIGTDWSYPELTSSEWHIEPLPHDSASGADWELTGSDGWTAEEEWASREERIRELRGDTVERVLLWNRVREPSVFSATPASSLALELLWNDLAEFAWVSGPFDHGTSVPSVRPRYA